MLLLPPSNFFKINFFKKLKECQTVWIQIRTDVLLVLIWVQTVCKGYQQATKHIISGLHVWARIFLCYWKRMLMVCQTLPLRTLRPPPPLEPSPPNMSQAFWVSPSQCRQKFGPSVEAVPDRLTRDILAPSQTRVVVSRRNRVKDQI